MQQASGAQATGLKMVGRLPSVTATSNSLASSTDSTSAGTSTGTSAGSSSGSTQAGTTPSDSSTTSVFASQIAADTALGYNINPTLGIPGAADGANGSIDRWDLTALTGSTPDQQLAAYNNAAAAYANPVAANPGSYAIGGSSRMA